MRITVLVFAVCVCAYAIALQGTSIYELVSGAYQVTLVGAFVPLVSGLYWKRATTQGAIFSIVLGMLTWVLFLATPAGEQFPAQLAGFVMALGRHGGRVARPAGRFATATARTTTSSACTAEWPA